MKLARRHVEEPHINLTSLIDVVFLLLIFFMVTTTFVHHAGLDIRLPQANLDSAQRRQDTLQVTVDAADRVYVGGKPVAEGRAALRARLQQAADGDFRRPLRINADGRASHRAVVRVMDVAAGLGFKRLDIATRPVEPGDG